MTDGTGKDDPQGMTYEKTGVNYGYMDPFKLLCQLAAMKTANYLERFGFTEIAESRGESAYVLDVGEFLLAFVVEGLGTKNKVAEAMYETIGHAFGKSYHDHVSQCNFAMNVNDLATVGADPFLVGMYLAAGDASWFKDERRNNDVVNGFKESCDIARCTWGGGETPTLRDIIYPDTVDLAGAALGVIRPKKNVLLGSKIRHGDAIILIASTGIHANGLTLARDIAAKLRNGYHAVLPSGRYYGEALLDRTKIYSPLVSACAGLLHYAVNITGHGLRKLMRAQQPFTYVVEKFHEPPEIFPFMLEHGPVAEREAFGNLNMGEGYALYAPQQNAATVCDIAKKLGYDAIIAGYIEKSEKRRVSLKVGEGIDFDENDLKVR
jgi:phosphoribosylformylglycinamidine cyclo-ligase